MARHKTVDGVDIPLTPEEEAELDARVAAFEARRLEELPAEVRVQRDRLLAATDWTHMLDVSQDIRDLWAPYRQALRDVPQQPGFPTDVTWPTKPE